MRSIGPAVTREQSPAFLRNSNGRLDLPGPTQEAACIPRRNARIRPQLEKNHVAPPPSQDEALSRYSASGEVPRSEWAVERALGTLDATHKVPRNPGLPRAEHRGFPAPPALSPFSPPDLDRRVDSPALSGRGSRPSARTPGSGRSHEDIPDVASWVVPHSVGPRFPGPLLIRTRCPDTSPNSTL